MARVMSAREKSIREQRAMVYGGMNELMEVWEEEGSLTGEQQREYDRREKELRDLDKDLDRIVKFNKLNEQREAAADTAGMSRDELESRTKDAHEKAFLAYLRRGVAGMTGDERRNLTEQRTTLDANAIATIGGSSNAGYLVPQGFWHNLQIALKQYGGLLNVARMVETSTGNPMPWPTTDPTAIIGNYVGNQGTQLGFQDYVFGQGMMHAWTITSNVALASLEAINYSAFGVETFVRDRIAESNGRFVASELHSGSGSSALLGIKTGLVAKGIVAGAAGGVYQPTAGGTVFKLGSGTAVNKLSSGTPGFDDILNMIAKIDPAYR